VVQDLAIPQGLPASAIVEITDTPDEKTPDGIIARRAVEELHKFQETGAPFFLAVGFYRPHMPLTAPRKYWGLYDRARVKPPADFRQPDDGIPRYDWEEVRRYGDCPWKGPMPEAKAAEIIQGYHASVTFVDAQIGKVLDAIRCLRLDKNTIVVLWSDNGWSLGEHGRFSKYTNYETSTHIVLMLKVPWLPAQPASPALVELVDLYPTLAELCRLPAPENLEGKSVVPLLTDSHRPWKIAAFSCLHKDRERTIRDRRYRLIEHPDGQLELYDHQTDPAEDHNLAKDPAHAAILKRLQSSLSAGWHAAGPSGDYFLTLIGLPCVMKRTSNHGLGARSATLTDTWPKPLGIM
jgi:iduronate 2-sulfatase